MTFKIGDKVKLNDCPFDAQIPEEGMMYAFIKTQIQFVTNTKRVFEEGSSGQWVKTNLIPDWIDSAWFTYAE